jgi:hypothetical protein
MSDKPISAERAAEMIGVPVATLVAGTGIAAGLTRRNVGGQLTFDRTEVVSLQERIRAGKIKPCLRCRGSGAVGSRGGRRREDKGKRTEQG